MPTSQVTDAFYPLIDTHTHFDEGVFDVDRFELAQSAYHVGVRHLLLIGYAAKYFDRLKSTQAQIQQYRAQNPANSVPVVHLTAGLHPAYIAEHTQEDLEYLADFIEHNPAIAIGEIGLDTFTKALKLPEAFAKQTQFFIAQLDLAVAYQLPVLLHVRKAHAETLAILKSHHYDAKKLGGIAHSFSGGVQEAKAFIKLGFKLGVTGQITNLKAKKLRRAIVAAVDEFGLECLVLETDCPDMMPVLCQLHQSHQQNSGKNNHQEKRNVPENLTMVLYGLSELLEVAVQTLAKQLWINSCDALKIDWKVD